MKVKGKKKGGWHGQSFLSKELLKCDFCGALMSRNKHKQRYAHEFCSQECFNEFRRLKNIRGET